MMMLKTVDEACDFIADWCGEKGNYAGQPVDADFAVPDCIVRLNARVGDLWRSAKRQPGPILQYATPFLGLLGGQDQILNPSGYVRDKNGIVPFVWENQGVWGYGFDPDDLARSIHPYTTDASPVRRRFALSECGGGAGGRSVRRPIVAVG